MKIKPRENFVLENFIRVRVCVHARVPGTGYHVAPLERSWSTRSAQARERSRYPCRITDSEGTAIGYLLRKILPVRLGPRFQLPSLPRSRAWADIEELSDLSGSGTPSTGFW